MALSKELQDLAHRVSNWGRWGPDDQRGTLNFITPDAVRRGAAAVRRGVSFSLAIPFDADGPQTGSIPGRINPQRRMLMFNTAFTGDRSDFTTSDDAFEMGTQAATHWDALSHVGYDGLLYNGITDDAIDERGAAKLGIEHFGPVVTRGVLLDIARLHGVDGLERRIRDRWRRSRRRPPRARVCAIESGDIVLVRTGNMRLLRRRRQARATPATRPGVGVGAIEWFHDSRGRGGRDRHARVRGLAVRGSALDAARPHARTCATRGWCRGSCGTSTRWPTTARPTVSTSSCSRRRRLPLTGAVGGPVAPTATK